MPGSSRRTALRLGGATLLSAALPATLSGCLGKSLPLLGNGAAPDVEWVRNYDYGHFDVGQALVRTADGGFAFVAEVSTVETKETTDSEEVRVVRTDPDGAERWTRAYGDPGIEFAADLVPATDGEGFVVGGSRSPGPEREFWLFRVDAAGRIEWGRTYGDGDAASAYLSSIAPAADGGYALAGGRSLEGRLVKVSSTGEHEWSRTYGPSDVPEYGRAGLIEAVPTGDGGHFLVGFASTSSETGFAWFRKTGPEGTVEWRVRHHLDGKDTRANDAVQTADGGLLVVGSTSSMNMWPWESDPNWALKFDADGRRVWRQSLGSAHPQCVVAEPDGGATIAARADGGVHLRRLDADGETVWRSKCSKVDAYTPDALVRADDGNGTSEGYVVLGRRRAGSVGDYGLTDAVMAELR